MYNGERFGRLIVLQARTKAYGAKKQTFPFALVECDCGTVKEVRRENLTRGLTKSCGCLQKDVMHDMKTTHGMTGTEAYRRWESMRRRCLNPNAEAYPRYGGKGVTICKRWDKFENFYEDMGEPEGLTLDRIDSSKGYSPKNCRWATCTTQSRNRKSNHVMELNGETHILIEWCELYDMDYNTVERRINLLGWELEKALTTQKRKLPKRTH